MPVKFGFYDLDVWRKSIEFGRQVYEVTQSYPADERFGLTSQLRRAAVSISSNVAEGSGRTSPADFCRFISIAYGSTMDVVSQVCLSLKLGYINRQQFDRLTIDADEIARMLSGLRDALKRT